MNFVKREVKEIFIAGIFPTGVGPGLGRIGLRVIISD
jgi:hypothetical protein